MSGRDVIRYILFILNLISTLFGIALLIFGVIIRLRPDVLQISSVFPQTSILATIFIAFGIFVSLISFCGCYGSIAKNKCLLNTFAVFMGKFVAITVIGTVLLYIFEKQIYEIVVRSIEYEFVYNRRSFHYIEGRLKCCGTIGQNSYLVKSGNLTLPTSCCIYPTPLTCVNDIFQTGCTTLILDYLQSMIWTTRVVLMSMSVYELMMIVTALISSCNK